ITVPCTRKRVRVHGTWRRVHGAGHVAAASETESLCDSGFPGCVPEVRLPRTHSSDRPRQSFARPVPTSVDIGQANGFAVGPGSTRRCTADPAEQQCVLALEVTVTAHPTGRPALGRVGAEG